MMDSTVLLILITVAVFAIGMVAAYMKFFILKKGKETGTDTREIIVGIDNAKDAAINELNKAKEANVKRNM